MIAAMKILRNITTLFAAFLMAMISYPGIASDLDAEEMITKQERRAENAAPDDWKTFADCANSLVANRIVTEEAMQWIDRSINIRETVFNRTVKGDYLVLKGKIREAQAEYVRAIELAKLENKPEQIGNIQWKIMISMGIDNYNKFQAENK